MAHPNPIRRLLDAGLQMSELTQANAERVVHELVKAGEVRRKDTEKVVREMLEHSREASERARVTVRDEVGKQFGAIAGRLDQVESLIEQLVARLTPGSPSAGDDAAPAPAPAAKKTAAKKTATKTAPKKKAPAKKATAPKKTAAKKQAAAPKQAATKQRATVKQAPAAPDAVQPVPHDPPPAVDEVISSEVAPAAIEQVGSAD